ncbi:hypothetical protein BGW36DRAFT_360524 [Talaromyces proteolyticus]|uniref:Postreplication repair E3 ubiquitin-protein ligase RAD18 n=1 Tax=Talaromyces proteolyticus TaxID=1131652 RepID=A0AAD4KRP6_9EURO|nr:uncharacterized protein BGW36DRAFT_360524 [Talaromyces proteolyticus]KAH8696707.1 hypothetical protein BGW36DRAFT_360524 [Talaromyces proteolyticus]
MDHSFDIPDSTDWLNTPLSGVASLESALRCQVCKDFFDTPVITSCSHTFCSLCIRRCLSAEGKCPACRCADQELKLRRNWAVQELVDTFKNIRPHMLALAQESAALDQEDPDSSQPATKKRRLDTADEEGQSRPGSRRTRSQAKAREAPVVQVPPEEDPEDEDYIPDDGLVACPMCNQRMKEGIVFSHLDICKGPQKSSKGSRSNRLPQQSFQYQQQSNIQPPDRLPVINYSLLKENALRKKMKELGIPDWGPRPLLQRRHTEWVNLFNANCDAIVPKAKRDLLKDLDIWERTQGGMASNMGAPVGPNAVMAKTFDATAWSTNHDDDFRRLIENARKKKDVKIREDSKVPQPSQGQTNVTGLPSDTNEASNVLPIEAPFTPFYNGKSSSDLQKELYSEDVINPDG